MNFKRLELQGFKSFADKTVIEFNDGITGIVGPNGSGKSNFADAVKWVLGARSPSDLRGKSMSDFIFAGTQSRKSVSFCEVTLVFDNTNHSIFKKLDFDEVKVTRKLFRSNNSEYYINGVPCRLSDIDEIIRDTGLGKEGYSIIGQGRVAQIVNSKPIDRRAIFEEAAGISNFKKKKSAAEKKLELTRDHMSRLDDIIREIERRLVPLAKQSENTRIYNELFESLKGLEVNHYLFAHDNNDSVLGKINDIINGIDEEITSILGKTQSVNTEYQETEYSRRRAEEDLVLVREERTQLLVANQEKLGSGKVLVERLQAFSSNVERLEGNIERNTIIVDDATASLEILNENLDKLKLQYKLIEEEYGIEEEKFFLLVDEISNKEKEFANSESAMFEAIDKLNNVNTDISTLKAQCELMIEKKSETEDDIAAIKIEIETDESAKVASEKIMIDLGLQRDEIYKDLSKFKSTTNELKLERDMTVRNIDKLTGSIAGYDQKRKVMIDVKNQYESFHLPVKRLMQQTKIDPVLDCKIIGVVAELIKVPTKYDVAIEVALGGALQNIVTPTTDDVKYCIEVLNKNRMGVITFYPVNNMRPRNLRPDLRSVLREVGCEGIASEIIAFKPEYNNVMSNLLGTTVICDTYENAIRINKKYNKEFRIVTLEGDVFNTQGSITGGSRRRDTIGLLSQDRDISQVVAALEECRANLAKNKSRLDEIDKLHATAFDNFKTANDELTFKEIAYNTKTNETNLISDKVDSNLDTLYALEVKYTKICDRIDEISLRLSGTDKLKSDFSTSRLDMSTAKSKSREMLGDKNVEKDKIKDSLTRIRVGKVTCESEVSKLKEDKEKLLVEIKQRKTLVLDDKSQLVSTLSNIKRTEAQINGAQLSTADQAKRDILENKISELENTKLVSQDRINQLIDLKDVNANDLISAESKKNLQLSAKSNLQTKFETLTQRIKEDYDLDYSGAVLHRVPDFKDEGVVTQISTLKRSISALGNINPSSVEEYKEESERFEKLSIERDDIVKAEGDLMAVVRDLSVQMQEQFDVEFGKISKNFEITFKEIFGGGSGKLVIDPDAEDPLNAGIDIIAAPPGKKSGNISLFSGGEMALTAIAILFSILKTSPMPFCVLDEIEAALDDSNVSLFARYLKRFVGNTQFIVITHRQPTMEQADRLYGVTMEEKGVSKIVSVQLSEAINVMKD